MNRPVGLLMVAVALNGLCLGSALAQTTDCSFLAQSGGTGGVRKISLGASYSSAHDASVGDSVLGYVQVTQSWDGNFYTIDRGFVTFNTSNLPDNATITSATLFVWVSIRSAYTAESIQLVSSNQQSASSLSTGDYSRLTTAVAGSAAASSLNPSSGSSADRAIPLNSTGLSLINKTGFTKFGLRDSRDVGNNSDTNPGFVWMAGAGSSTAPFLCVTYTTSCTPPLAPTLLLPTNGSVTNDTTPDLTWSLPPNSSTFQVDISTNSSFTNIVNQQINWASTTYTPTLGSGTYYWRVAAWTAGPGACEGSFSSTSSFTISSGTVCGNGVVESPEQCDDGNTVSGDCCDSACQPESTGSQTCGQGACMRTRARCLNGMPVTCVPGSPGVEGPAGSPSCSNSLDDDCDGLTDGADPGCVGACPNGNGLYCGQSVGLTAGTLYQCTNGAYTASQVCANGCQVNSPGTNDNCKQCDEGSANGTSTSCCTSSYQYRTSGQVCRVSAGACDLAETCTGTSGTCPTDAFQPAGAQCRTSTNIACDPPEACPGNSATCPCPCVDTDGDGLCDDWEQNGIRDEYGNMKVDLHKMGADPLYQDIFIQVDYMTQPGFCPLGVCFFGHTHRPSQAAMDILIQAFAKHDITLHIDAGADTVMNPRIAATGPSPCIPASRCWGSDSQSNELPHELKIGTWQQETDGNCAYNWSRFRDIQRGHFREPRSKAFHYVIFAHQLGVDCTGKRCISGIAQLPGSDLIVALGNGGIEERCARDGTDMEQAGTLMHELGHNLGLYHGGSVDISFKPNYLSVMNYSFQTRGLRINGVDANFDYSSEELPDLDEKALQEAGGIFKFPPAQPVGTRYYCNGEERVLNNAVGPIDWNCDLQTANSPIQADVNNSPAGTPQFKGEVLRGYNDWTNLVLRFDEGKIGSALGQNVESPIQTAASELTAEMDSLIATSFALSVVGPGDVFVVPGQVVGYDFRVSNAGTQADTYDLVASSTAGWGDLSSVPASVALVAGDSTVIHVSVEVPPGTPEGTQDRLLLRAVSQANSLLLGSATAVTTAAILDSDVDGILDVIDNCPFIANADQSDANGDGVGDTCSVALSRANFAFRKTKGEADDAYSIVGFVDLPDEPNPMADGVSITIPDPNGGEDIVNVSVPGGAFDPTSTKRLGWILNNTGTVYTYKARLAGDGNVVAPPPGNITRFKIIDRDTSKPGGLHKVIVRAEHLNLDVLQGGLVAEPLPPQHIETKLRIGTLAGLALSASTDKCIYKAGGAAKPLRLTCTMSVPR